MTPIQTLQPGQDYRLPYGIGNPCSNSMREMDWRLQNHWPSDMVFHCFRCYIGHGRSAPALYVGIRVGEMVHEDCMPDVFNAILPYLVPA